MYILLGTVLAICLLLICLQIWRRRRLIRKVKSMELCAKVNLLNELLFPFGFCYQQSADIVTSVVAAWQRQFGYCSLYDQSALHFGMVFDCEPLFFYYGGRTYRIELWKGQYGINLGAEIGVYYAEGIQKPEDFDSVRFQSIPNEELRVLEMILYYKGQKVFEGSCAHWWLAGFCMGQFAEPEELVMRVSITCMDQGMVSAFAKSLLHAGYPKCSLSICGLTVSFTFGCPFARQPRQEKKYRAAWVQGKNRRLCRLFLWVTRPFSCTLDRLLYLYFYLPFVFRRILKYKKSRKQKFCKRRYCQDNQEQESCEGNRRQNRQSQESCTGKHCQDNQGQESREGKRRHRRQNRQSQESCTGKHFQDNQNPKSRKGNRRQKNAIEQETKKGRQL